MGGASIGIRDRTDCTATLGGYLNIDGYAHALTVDHIVPEDLREDIDSIPIIMTHPSEQDSIVSLQTKQLTDYASNMRTLCCVQCMLLWQHYHGDQNFIELDLINAKTVRQCPQAQEYARLKKQVSGTMGKMIWRSGTRSRDSLTGNGQYQVEMDWAVVSTEDWPANLDEPIQAWSKDKCFAKISPRARVRSCGRTSGNQTGEISAARSIINQGPRWKPRFTEEWAVIKRPETSWKDWIEGGVGVDGDSGSWIIDQDTNALYGMVWGRDRIKTQPICLFSPILEIIEDIKERMGAKVVCLPGQLQSTEVPNKGKGREEQMVWTLPIHTTRSNARDVMVSEQPVYADRIY
jgi:hypothetical protein